MFITDCFIQKLHTKRISIPSAIVGLFCLSNWFLYLLVGLLIGCSVCCLVAFFFGWLVGRFWLVGWFWFILVPVDCSLDHTTTISLLGFTEHKSSADHNGWQPGRKWTSQIWNVAHCLETLGRGQCTYTYDISQLPIKVTCCHSWIVKILIFSVILMWQLVEKKSINFCPGVYLEISKCVSVQIWFLQTIFLCHCKVLCV